MVFLILNQNGIALYSKGTVPPPLVFPDSIVRHQEIQDRKQYEKLLADYFAHFSKNQIIILLSSEVVFQKTLSNITAPDLSSEEEKFMSSVPFPKDDIQKIAIRKKSTVTFFATNGNIYKSIIGVLEQQNSQVRHVFPIILFAELLQGNEISFATLSRLLKEKKLLQAGDFLATQKDQISPQKMTKQSMRKQLILLIFSILFFLLALFVALKQFNLFPYPPQPRALPQQAITTPSFILKGSSSPTITQEPTLQKGELSVQILNGSGVVGQATTVKEELGNIGLKNILTDNALSTDFKTTIVFDKNVSKEVQDEVVMTLSKRFTTIDQSVASSSSGFDIVISTGRGVK